MENVTAAGIGTAAAALGLSGLPVCLHSSLRSFGHVEGGAEAVVDGFLGEGCTLLVPAFSYGFAAPPPPGPGPARNGRGDGGGGPPLAPGPAYAPDSGEISAKDMGAVPVAVLARPGRHRGNHPLNSFAAVGAGAGRLVEGQTPADVFAPLRALGEAGGWVVLAGVGLKRMTLLHAAEEAAGRRPFVRWARNGAETLAVRTGGCSGGFENLRPALASLGRFRRVGASAWEAYPAGPALITAAEAIRRDPGITHCGDPRCERCRDAVLGGPIAE